MVLFQPYRSKSSASLWKIRHCVLFVYIIIWLYHGFLLILHAVMRRILTSILAALMLCLTARAQVRLYVCHHDSCEVYDTEHIDSITFLGRNFRIDGQSPYSALQVDSMMFKQPANLTMEERGWWGDMREGESYFLAVLTVEHDDFHFDYHVRFSFTANDSICQTAKCELLFDEEWQWILFFGKEDDTTGGPPGEGDPYIYVKETLTGPRRFEIWKMDDPVLPESCVWKVSADRLAMYSDCSPVLLGRPMSEVKIIVEAWLFQPLKQIENPYYNNVEP